MASWCWISVIVGWGWSTFLGYPDWPKKTNSERFWKIENVIRLGAFSQSPMKIINRVGGVDQSANLGGQTYKIAKSYQVYSKEQTGTAYSSLHFHRKWSELASALSHVAA